jgi:hypothetical protein
LGRCFFNCTIKAFEQCPSTSPLGAALLHSPPLLRVLESIFHSALSFGWIIFLT